MGRNQCTSVPLTAAILKTINTSCKCPNALDSVFRVLFTRSLVVFRIFTVQYGGRCVEVRSSGFSELVLQQYSWLQSQQNLCVWSPKLPSFVERGFTDTFFWGSINWPCRTCNKRVLFQTQGAGEFCCKWLRRQDSQDMGYRDKAHVAWT